MEWYQCLTIIASMLGMMMWASRERRTDNLFMLKLIDEIRKDVLTINNKISLQEQEFKNRMEKFDSKFKDNMIHEQKKGKQGK